MTFIRASQLFTFSVLFLGVFSARVHAADDLVWNKATVKTANELRHESRKNDEIKSKNDHLADANKQDLKNATIFGGGSAAAGSAIYSLGKAKHSPRAKTAGGVLIGGGVIYSLAFPVPQIALRDRKKDIQDPFADAKNGGLRHFEALRRVINTDGSPSYDIEGYSALTDALTKQLEEIDREIMKAAASDDEPLPAFVKACKVLKGLLETEIAEMEKYKIKYDWMPIVKSQIADGTFVEKCAPNLGRTYADIAKPEDRDDKNQHIEKDDKK